MLQTVPAERDSSCEQMPAPSLQVSLARGLEQVEEAQALRYQVFALEQGARLQEARAGLDADRFDPLCEHLLVRDTGSGRVVACTRLLSDVAAVRAGGYYSASEFDLTPILALPGRILEVGRTCVAAGYRNGATIAVLWSGLADYLLAHRFDSLMGCASIDLSDGGGQARAILERLWADHLSPPSLRVTPLRALPALPPPAEARMPPLLKAYLRLGAWVCGEASHDPDFNVADVLILLDVERLAQRYTRHFLDRAAGRGARSSPPALAAAPGA